MKGLDQWITGGQGHKSTCDCTCPTGHHWTCEGWSEYGFFDPDIEDEYLICPICGQLNREVKEGKDL